MTFEEKLEKLEEVLKKLESGEASLDESLKLFEEGVTLTRECSELLSGAEAKVKKLTEGADGTATEEDFEPMGEA